MTAEKLTFSGPLLDVEIYPASADGRHARSRAPKSKPTTAEQERCNRARSVRRFIRLVNANFGPDDYLMHPTYLPDRAPASEDEARRDIVNFFRRVKTRRAAELRSVRRELDELERTAIRDSLAAAKRRLENRLSKLSEPLRYIYVIERQTYKRGQYRGRDNYHFHIFVTGGLPERVMEEMWRGGIRVNCNRFQPDTFGPDAAARYMSKDPQGSKRFCCSRNLVQPTEKLRRSKMSARTVEKIARQRADDREYWESRYRGYKFLRCQASFNPYNGRWYVTALMYRTSASPPRWQTEEFF